jgi:DNA ligase D-like protein (predicted ligase)
LNIPLLSTTITCVSKDGLDRPGYIQPMAAKVVAQLPEGEEWMYEVKLDGYRALLIKRDLQVQIRSRNDKDLTATYPDVATAGKRLHARSAVVDGEIVALDPHGRPSFQALQHRGSHRGHAIVFYAFDLLHLDGHDLTSSSLQSRRAQLADVIDGSGVLMSVDLEGSAQQVITAVRELGLEGVVAKRKASRYVPGDGHTSWVKLKLDRQQEFVIGGYRPGPHGVDSLLVGYYEARKLRFAAKVRAGFTPHLRREVFVQLRGAHTAACPFADLPSSKVSRWGGGVTADEMTEIQWVNPVAAAQIRFVEWTADGHLRHSAFLGLRADKDPGRIGREP